MTQASHTRPSGYQKADIDIAGWWIPEEGPIHGKVIGGVRFRNTKRRLTTLYLVRLKEPCICNVKLESKELAPATVGNGEVVAVFHSGGLHRLSNLYGCMVWIADRFDDKGEWLTKPVPAGDMKLYEILYSGKQGKVPIETRVAKDNEPVDSNDDAIDYPDDDEDPDF